VVIVSGDIGVHGVAIMSVREGLQFGTDIESDTQPLNGLVAEMLAAHRDIHVLRDPTRGGVATSLNEIARASKVGVRLDEGRLPIPEVVSNACAFLGLDPLQVANEGKLLAFVPRSAADLVLEAMRAHPAGLGACVIGQVIEDHPGLVATTTAFGASRVVDLPVGEQLPRIC
jgi:hydrogenase expression/formation protein HypE